MRQLFPSALTLAFVAPFAAAQGTPEPTAQLGGTLIGTWVHEDLTTPGEFILWTAETGPRIRRVHTSGATGIAFETFERIPGYNTGVALHDVFVTDVLDGAGAASGYLDGLAVGSDGYAFWAVNLRYDNSFDPTAPDEPHWARFLPEPLSLAQKEPHLWESYMLQAADGELDYALIAGEEDTLIYTTTTLTSGWTEATVVENPTCPELYPRDFLSIGIVDPASTGGQIRGAVGARARTPAGCTRPRGIYYTTDGLVWTAANILLPADYPDPTLPVAEQETLAIWGIDFVPGSDSVGFAVGGHRLGNGRGYAFITVDGGKIWRPLYNACSPHAPANGLCVEDTDPYVPPTCHDPSIVCDCELGIFPLESFPTMYEVTALPNLTAVAASYGAGMWRFNRIQQVWENHADSRIFGTGPLWGLHGGGQGLIAISGQFGELRGSTDGGSSWDQMSQTWLWRTADIGFADAMTGWVVGQGYLVGKTIDGGATWTQERYDRGTAANLRSLAVHDANHVVAVGNPLEEGYLPAVFYTKDGGATCWLRGEVCDGAPPPCVLPFPLPPIHDVAARGATGADGEPDYLAVGSSAETWRSDDGGASWSRGAVAGLPGSFHARSVAFATPEWGFVVGDHGAPNTGDAWLVRYDALTAVYTATPASPPAGTENLLGVAGTLDAAGDLVAYAVGARGTVLKYSAPTASPGSFACAPNTVACTPDNPPTAALFAGVAVMLDGSSVVAYVSGDRGTMYRAVDDDWQVMSSATTDFARGMSFVSPSLGWITGLNTDEAAPPGAGPHTPNAWGDSTIVKFE